MQSQHEYNFDWPSLPSASSASIHEGIPPNGSRREPGRRGVRLETAPEPETELRPEPETEPQPEPDTELQQQPAELVSELARLRAERDALMAAAARAAMASAMGQSSAYILGQRLPGDLEEGLCVEFKDTERHRFSANINKYVLKTVTGFL